MSDSDLLPSSRFRDWLSIHADAFGVIGGVVLVLTLIPTIAKWLPWPWFLIPLTIGATLFCVWVFARVFIVNSEPLLAIGYTPNKFVTLRNENPVFLKPKGHVREVSVLPSSSERPRTLLEELEQEYDVKKLEPSLLEFGSEYVTAHNDENGVIVQSQSARDMFPVLVRSFGNQHPRDRVKSLKRVSFRLDFICFDRAVMNQSKIIRIHRGAWLNEASVEVEFPAHCPPRRAVVVTVEGAESKVYAVRRDSDSTYKGIMPLREELTGDIYTVSLTLLVESKNAKSFQYILEIIREPTVELRLNNAYVWKSTHLLNFIKEGYKFLDNINRIGKEAREQVPLPELPEVSQYSLLSNAFKRRLEGVETPDISELLKRISAIEREQEEKILDLIKDWESRAREWVDRFIGAEARDKILQSGPSFDIGLNRGRKSALQLMGPPTRAGKEPSPPQLRYWTLSDAVGARVDALTNIEKQLQ